MLPPPPNRLIEDGMDTLTDMMEGATAAAVLLPCLIAPFLSTTNGPALFFITVALFLLLRFLQVFSRPEVPKVFFADDDLEEDDDYVASKSNPMRKLVGQCPTLTHMLVWMLIYLIYIYIILYK